MASTALIAIDDDVAGAVARLHTLMETELRGAELGTVLDQIKAVAHATGGELLFELPADHPSLGEMQWAVLRYANDNGEAFIHIFFSLDQANFWIGGEDQAPDDFARFAHAWTNVLTLCLNDLPVQRADTTRLQ